MPLLNLSDETFTTLLSTLRNAKTDTQTLKKQEFENGSRKEAINLVYRVRAIEDCIAVLEEFA